MSYPEARMDHFEHLVDAYACISAYGTKSEEIESDIQRLFVDAATSKPTFDAIHSLAGQVLADRRSLACRSAWTLQHAFNCRSYCIKSQIIQSRTVAEGTRLHSPILRQIMLMGEPAAPRNLSYHKDRLKDLGARKTIDALLIDRSKSIIYVICAKSLSQLLNSKTSPPTLFTKPDREIHNLHVDSGCTSAVKISADIISDALPHYTVKSAISVHDDPESGAGFQLHDISEIANIKKSSSICLDDFPVIQSSRLIRQSGGDLDHLDTIPNWPAQDPLNNLPSDRATRCLMSLSELWAYQSSDPNLTGLTWRRLGDLVQEKYKIAYSRDHRRHDIEDCLERSAYVTRLTYDPNKFAITPRGLARILLFRRLLSDFSVAEHDNGFAFGILPLLQEQALRLARYRDGVRNSGNE